MQHSLLPITHPSCTTQITAIPQLSTLHYSLAFLLHSPSLFLALSFTLLHSSWPSPSLSYSSWSFSFTLLHSSWPSPLLFSFTLLGPSPSHFFTILWSFSFTLLRYPLALLHSPSLFMPPMQQWIYLSV